MPIKDGRVYVSVKCVCGTENGISSGNYGTYCSGCGKAVLASAYTDDINAEIRKVVKEEKLKLRRSGKSSDFSVGGSSLLSICKHCGAPLNAGSIYVVDGETVCRKCYENDIPKCKGCGERHFSKLLKNMLCEGCAISFIVCDNCQATYDKRRHKPIVVEGKTYCNSCVKKYLSSHNIIFHDHSHKPRACFFGDKEDGYFFGAEVEMDNSDRRNEFMATANCEEIYFKSDGSLGNDGVEVVTHPATLKYHMEELPWENIFTAAKKCGFRSHTGCSGGSGSACPTCGLHIHVSKTAFGRSGDERDKREAKMLVLFDKFWPQLVIFSRRDKKALETWARRYASFDVTKDELTSIITKAKGENGHGKHLAVNFNGNGGDTIEFRLFRGTTNRETLMASMQLLEMLIDFTKKPTAKVQAVTWEDFCEEASGKYYEFRGYISRLRSMPRYEGKI
jgi:hypothetical protein